MASYVGVDIGGTFTDLAGFDAETGRLVFSKSLTRYPDLVSGIKTCLDLADIKAIDVNIFKHGTTLVINTLLERRGARTALLTTAGFRDVLEIGRAGRPIVFDLDYARHPPLVPRRLRWEAKERIDAAGTVLVPLDEAELEAVAQRVEAEGIQALAICFLNAYKNPSHERQAAQLLRRRLPAVYVSASTELSGDWFEFERTSTAVANAYVGPQAATYVDHFDEHLKRDGFSGSLLLMSSNGGVMSVERTKQQPLALVESGPVGGCIGAAVYARALNLPQIIAFDMGGTTTKCALIQQFDYEIENTYHVGGYAYGFPVRTPVLDIVEVGTGGGSIVALDENGRLKVGPRSAGSTPGPACFGKGGTEPTVTDANLALDRIGGPAFLDGALKLDRQASLRALMERVGTPLGFDSTRVDSVAMGVLSLATAQMMSAIKEITVERGKDTRDFTFFVFGGGGGLHAADIARELHIGRVIVPPQPGNFSAVGMLLANARMDVSRTFLSGLESASPTAIWAEIDEMGATVTEALRSDFGQVEVLLEQQLEMRYKGQRHSVKVPVYSGDQMEGIRERFLSIYLERYGLEDPVCPIEMIGIRVIGRAISDALDLSKLHSAPVSGKSSPIAHREVHFEELGSRTRTPIFLRKDLPIGFAQKGPAVIEEFSSTTLVGPRDQFSIGQLGEIQIEVG